MLEGNLFSCKTDRSDLLENDPKADTYECGSDSTNYALIICVLLLICLTLFMICMRQIRKTATWSMESFQLQYTETSIDIDVLWKHIQHSVYIMVGMWLLGMVLFAIVSCLSISRFMQMSMCGLYQEFIKWVRFQHWQCSLGSLSVSYW